jgi:phosphopantetheinyl transferase
MDWEQTKCYLFNLEGLTLADLPSCAYNLLSKSELEQCLSFDSEQNQVVHLCSQFLRRRLIANALGIPAAALSFTVGSLGKPTVLPSEPMTIKRIEFNVSHSGHYLAIILTRHGSCGVDIEILDTSLDTLSILKGTPFSAREIDFVANTPNRRESLLRFYQVWTLKEAFLKASGEGLSGLEKLDLFEYLDLHYLDGEAKALSHSQNMTFGVHASEHYVISYLVDRDIDTLPFIKVSPSDTIRTIEGRSVLA